MISVIVPFLNWKLAQRCIFSCMNSKDDSYNLQVEYQSMWDEKGEGPAVLRNRGAKKATGDILFFIDSDATVYPETLSWVALHFQNPKVDGVTIIWDKIPLENNFFNKFKALEMNHTMSHYFLRACASNGTAIRKSVFETVGGFDEQYKDACVEDFHFGLKVFKAGYNIVFDKTIKMQHSFCNSTWQGLIKYCKRAFQRAKLLVENNTETSYNSNKMKLLYFSVLFPPIFLWLNRDLYKDFWKESWWFFVRASILYYFYVALVATCGLAGYGYAFVCKKFF
jgi:glycosyltransferase involved in cell wall biosynthesis